MEKPFRLLELPAKVRDQIYYEILCTWPAYKSTWDEENPNEVAIMDGKSRIAILCTSRDVCLEAGAVMLRGNQFIRISIKGHQPLQVLFIPSQVPVVNMNQKFITKFGAFVMTHSIDFANDPAPLKSQFEVMIIRRDLDRFVQALGKADLISPNFTATSKHRITIHNPFLGTAAQDFWTKENKERLLAPYREQLHGFKNFKIDGYVKKDVADAVIKAVRKERIPDPIQVPCTTHLTINLLHHTHARREMNEVKEIKPYQWGFAIYRTVYTPQSDELWSSVLEKLETYMELSCEDPDYRDELSNVVVWDREKFNNAPIDEIRKDFKRELLIPEMGGDEFSSGDDFETETRKYDLRCQKEAELAEELGDDALAGEVTDSYCLLIDDEVSILS